MKRIICALATFLFTASLLSCSSENNESSSKPVETTTITSTETSTTSTITSTATTTTTTIITTTEIITTIAETEPPVAESVISSKEYVDKIGEALSLDSTQEKFGALIGALDGYAFKYQGLSFEIYKYESGSQQLTDGSTGTIDLTLQGFGILTRRSVVNGNYLMICEESNDDVINAFMNVTV